MGDASPPCPIQRFIDEFNRLIFTNQRVQLEVEHYVEGEEWLILASESLLLC